VPDLLADLWCAAGSMRLFEDVTYGQTGLVLVFPTRAIELTKFQESVMQEKMEFGDLVIGEFLGDSDLLMLRCDENSPDFGKVLVMLPLDARKDWPVAGTTLGEFLLRFMSELGRPWWS